MAEEALAPSDDDRVDIEPVLVDQVVPHEGCGEVGPAEHQVSTGLRLELHDLLGDDVSDHRGVPVGPLQGPGVHDLGHVPPDAGELDHGPGTRGVGVGCRPESGHQLVGDTSVQEGAHRAELLVEVAVQLVVDQVPIELAVRSLEEAIKRHRHHQDDLSHRGSLVAASSRCTVSGENAGRQTAMYWPPPCPGEL